VRRHLRREETGLTLIEMLVTIAVLVVGFLALVSAFAQAELRVSSTSDAAQLASHARQVGDAIKAESLAYVQCSGPQGQAPSGHTTYQAALRSSGAMTTRDTVSSVAQAVSSRSSHTVSGVPAPLVAINSCASAGTSSNADYGVQQITFQVVASDGRALVRVVYKRWN